MLCKNYPNCDTKVIKEKILVDLVNKKIIYIAIVKINEDYHMLDGTKKRTN